MSPELFATYVSLSVLHLSALLTYKSTCKSGSTSISGAWSLLPPNDSTSEYIIANLTGAAINKALVTFNLRVAASGNYSIRVLTPGCIQSGTCSTRGRVNITGSFADPASVIAGNIVTVLSQTNDFDKYDEIYTGFVQAATADFTPSVNMTPIADGVINGQLTVVAQAVEALFNGEIPSPSPGNTTSATASSSIATTVSTSSTASSTTSQIAQSHHLDNGGKIGLGVGLPLGLLLITACIAIVLLKRRKRAEKTRLPPELDGVSVHMAGPGHANMPEMAAPANILEMPAHVNKSEIPAPPVYNDLVELKATSES